MNEDMLKDIDKRGKMFGAIIYTESGLMQFVTYDHKGCVDFVSREVDNVELFNRDGNTNCGTNVGNFKIKK
jgi:hypothetical protein